MTPVRFRFDPEGHEYIDLSTGAVLPHITGMLERTGWVDDTWFTEESSERGSAVHRLTADYDLGAVDLDSCVSRWRPYLLGHVAALAVLQPEILAVEEPLVHPVYRYGGRPDRRIVYAGMRGVLEEKSGAEAPQKRSPRTGHVTSSHALQTALQCILVAADDPVVVPEALVRLCLYVKPSGKFKVVLHKDPRDFEEARLIIRACCADGVAA